MITKELCQELLALSPEEKTEIIQLLDRINKTPKVVITLNYNDFKNLHKRGRNHCGIVICISTRRKEDRDNFADSARRRLRQRIDMELRDKEFLEGELIRVNRANKQ